MQLPAPETRTTVPPPAHQKNILCLDGGGIRGLSILYILQDLMERIRKERGSKTTPLPCELFDLIIGTSTGGLIALMLGRLRMSVNAAIDAYLDLSERVFGKLGKQVDYWQWLPLRSLLSTEPQFSAANLEAAIQTYAKDMPLADPDPDTCRTAVVAVKQWAASDLPDLLRTYETNTGYLECRISDAARATTAATGFFAPAKVQVKHALEVTYLDGGLGHNNPTLLSIREAEEIWGRNCKINCIISIGTGTTEPVNFKGRKWQLARKLVKIQTNCNKVHTVVERQFAEQDGVYFRLDASTDLSRIGLAKYKKLKEVGELTHAYIQREDVKFGHCVNAIIKTRTDNAIPPRDVEINTI